MATAPQSDRAAFLREQVAIATAYYRQLPPMDLPGHLSTARDIDAFSAELAAIEAQAA